MPSDAWTHSSLTSISLLQLAQQDDPEAWRRLVRVYGELVYGWARSFRLQQEDAADVMQDVFQVVHRSLVRFQRQENGAFRGWLWTITRNKVRDLIRSQKTRPLVPGGEAIYQRLLQLSEATEVELLPECHVAQSDLIQRAAELIREDFDPKSWACFERIVFNEQSAAAVAQELNMSVAAVRQAKYRVLRHLQTFCADFL
jgi:RNA polymerase sigma-70 factor (ECF subfamily)